MVATRTRVGERGHALSDEGMRLLADPTSINFVGDGVTATANVDGSATVTIPGGGSPSGTAGGELAGTYPNPSVDDGADATAIHNNVSGEITAIAEKTAPVAADVVVVEDSEAGNAKKRVQLGNLPAVTVRATQSVGSLALDGTFAAVTGASIVLPVAGTYRVAFHGRGSVDAPSKFCTYRLFNVTTSTAIPDTETIAGFDNAGTFTSSQNMGSNEAFITIASATTVRLEARGNVATGCASVDDANGHTVISAHKL